MNISEIKDLLSSEEPQLRLRGLVALKDYDSETAVPLLIHQRRDSAFLVRSFVAMGLGRKRNDTAYSTLLEMLDAETDSNVQSEIANSLGLYGAIATERLVQLFESNEHWLVQRSILAIMPEMDSPEALLKIALKALRNSDQTISQAGISTLGLLAGTDQEQAALEALLPMLESDLWRSRLALAYALKHFQTNSAKDALAKLRKDENHKVVAAALEDLLPTEPS
ncbi:MAG: phycocyanobilin lyase [Leptolyngbya foveolarum]|uniref:Phycocyanobilin lyase n=1 Tax=Leptolyngbya foveolarum TaxID=47253 RepID=A0A2W4TV78_9CYAN|nr:MAG: phycocyanobilin lyase [Leptolyngbya foveolarum]